MAVLAGLLGHGEGDQLELLLEGFGVGQFLGAELLRPGLLQFDLALVARGHRQGQLAG